VFFNRFGRFFGSLLFVFLGIFFCHAINLECEFREALASGWENVKSGKECRAKNLVVTSPNQEITSINGIAGSDAINNDVTAFYIHAQTADYFPRGLEKFFPNIEVIYFNFCKLKVIKKQDLKVFPQLKEIYLQFNEIEKLNDDLFAANEKLLYVNLHSNKIDFIGTEIFEPLKQLKTLYLNRNQCIDKDAVNDVNKVKELINEAKVKCYV
jgi:Leucine-rich repeat (LRR) protein